MLPSLSHMYRHIHTILFIILVMSHSLHQLENEKERHKIG